MRRIIRAEMIKLRSLPAVTYTMLGTVAVGAIMSVAFTALARENSTPASVATLATQVTPYAQAGAILLGILSVSHEYAGRQIATTLAAAPRRALLIVAKTAATAVALSVTAIGTMTVAWSAVALASGGSDAVAPTEWLDLVRLLGAAAYLLLIGLLAHATALAVRNLIPALTVMLVLVFILPPMLSVLGDHVRWLPDRAGAQLYAPSDASLTAATGALVVIGWITTVGIAGGARFIRSDA